MAQKLLATSILAACLTTTSLIPGSAMAKDPELSFYPKNKWTIEQVGTSANKNLNTCAISNQLNNGYIVQLAGTSDGFTNLNIDFRQDSFRKNIKYEVKYSVPGVVEKTIPTKAFKKNLLVSDLRSEKDFSVALRTASVLDVQIQSNRFRVYMTGLESAMEEYTECIDPQGIMAETGHQEKKGKIAAQQIPQQPKKVEGAHAPPPPLNISSYPNGEADVQQSIDQDIAEMPTHKLRPKPSNKPRYTEQLAQELKEESKKYQPDPDKKAIVEEKITEKMEPEASTSENQKSGTKISKAHAPEIISAPQAEEKHITHEKIRSPKPVYHVTKTESVSVDLTNTNQQEKIATRDIEADKTAQSLASIESSSGGAGENIDFINMRNKISELESKIGVLVSKNKMLDEELKIALQDAEKEQMSVSSDNWNLERATMKFNEAERQIMRLGRQLQTHKAQCQQQKAELENMLFDPELTNQQQLANLASLESELDTAKSDFYRQQRQYEERIRLLEEQLNAQ